jgi:23S rRNA (cytidine1920-2'-O)/16S rRNA (cytidine1409-2'-O)-methyltransferase
MKVRADKLLADRGLVKSRERAKALIMAGQVIIGDHKVEKAGQLVDDALEVRIKNDLHFVSRGGLKIEKALKEFNIDVTGLTVMDVGASTGGFTDCLLQRGAVRVFAVDVGYGQLAWKLQQDPRVFSFEKTNIRYLEPATLPAVPDMAVIDASFISLDKVLPNTLKLVKSFGAVVALIKPQFEVGRGEVGRGGVVRDPEKHAAVIESVCSLAKDLNLETVAVTESPITGPKGNREFLVYLKKRY